METPPPVYYEPAHQSNPAAAGAPSPVLEESDAGEEFSADTDEDFDSRAYSTSSGYVGDEAGENTDLGNDSGNESDVEACIEALIEATVAMLAQVSSCDEQISDCDSDDLGDLLDDTEPRTSMCEH